VIVDKARVVYRGPEATLVLCWGLKKLSASSFSNGAGLVPFPEEGGAIPAFAFDSFVAPDTDGELVFNAEPLSAVLDLSQLEGLVVGQRYGSFVWLTRDTPSVQESSILEGVSGVPFIVVEDQVVEITG
jgi:hypothetical protein